MKKITVVFFFISLFSMIHAEPVNTKLLPRYFRIMNLDQFSDYRFYYQYQTYPYHNSFQKGPRIHTDLFQDSVYKGGDGCDAVYLEAEDKSGKIYHSNILVGGKYTHSTKDVSYVEDRFEIVKIENGVIRLKCHKEIVSRKDGSLDEKLGLLFSGQIISPGAAGRMGLIVLPLVFGLLLAFLMYVRHKTTRRIGGHLDDDNVLQKE